VPYVHLVDGAVDGASIRAAAEEALDTGHSVLVRCAPDGSVAAEIALSAPIGATVDLDALDHDVRSWLHAAERFYPPSDNEEIKAAISRLRASTFGDYLARADDLSPASIGSAIERAIVLGEDPAVAIARYLHTDSGSHYFWHDANERPPTLPAEDEPA
jgi:hypothetical protein